MFTLKNLKNYSNNELLNFRAKALLSQGNGANFSKMLENRISKIDKEFNKRGFTY